MCLCLFSSGSNEPCSRMVWQDLTLDPASEVLTEVLCVKVPFCCFSYIYICFCVEERELNNQKTQIQPKSIPSRLKKEQQYFWVWVLKCFEHSLCQVLTDEVFAQPSVSSEEM